MENSVLDKLLDHFRDHSQVALSGSKRDQLKAHLTSAPPFQLQGNIDEMLASLQ